MSKTTPPLQEKKPILQPNGLRHHATKWKNQPTNKGGHTEEIGDLTPEQHTFSLIVSNHRAQERHARRSARLIIKQLRTTQSREMAAFPHMIDSLCEVMGVDRDHRELVFTLVTECTNLDLKKA